MNKTELVNAAAKKAGLTIKDTDAALNAVLEVMEDAVKEDHNSYLEMYNRIADAVPEMLKTPMTVKLLPMV